MTLKVLYVTVYFELVSNHYGDIACPCCGKYARFINGLTEATKLLYVYNNRLYRYLLHFFVCVV